MLNLIFRLTTVSITKHPFLVAVDDAFFFFCLFTLLFRLLNNNNKKKLCIAVSTD